MGDGLCNAIVLGVAKTFSDEVSMVKDGRFVFYWYEFLDIRGAEKKVC